jgi:hypothetical protein
MARPEKEGIDYFSHDVNSGNDQRLEYIEAVHGLNGYGVYFKLLERIYSNGYWIPWSDRDTTLLSKRVNVDINSINAIINDLLNEGLLNKELFISHKIFTSSSIQRRYFSSIERRKKVFLVKEFLLIKPLFTEKTVIEYINPVNVAQTIVNDNINTQSKVKESKVKERIKTFSSDSIEVGLAEILLKKISDRNPTFKTPNIQTWAKNISLMLTRDARAPDDIKAVIEWCQEDLFWQNNILSAEKLRKQFDQLYLKMRGNNGTNNRRPDFTGGTGKTFGKAQSDSQPYPIDYELGPG